MKAFWIRQTSWKSEEACTIASQQASWSNLNYVLYSVWRYLFMDQSDLEKVDGESPTTKQLFLVENTFGFQTSKNATNQNANHVFIFTASSFKTAKSRELHWSQQTGANNTQFKNACRSRLRNACAKSTTWYQMPREGENSRILLKALTIHTKENDQIA